MSDHRLRRAASLLLLAACVVGLNGCGSILCHLVRGGCGPIAARELYRLAIPNDERIDSAATATDGNSRPLTGTLAITSYIAPGVYAQDGIVYRIDDTRYGVYPEREWAVPLGEQLGMLTERVLARVPLTADRALFDPPSPRSQTYIWRGTIREFEEADRGNQVLAAVRLDIRIVRTADDSVVWSGSTHLERTAVSPNMPGIVQTLSELAEEAITDLATRARADLRASHP